MGRDPSPGTSYHGRDRDRNWGERRRDYRDREGRDRGRSVERERDRELTGSEKEEDALVLVPERRTEKRREMPRSRSRDRDRKRKRSRSPSAHASSLSSTSHRPLKKEKKGKRRETSAERAVRKEREREKKARKEEKRRKKEGGGGGVEWGKYGVISESDIFEKEAEFRLWLVEERFNPETLPKPKKKSSSVPSSKTTTPPPSLTPNTTLSPHSTQLSVLRMGESLVSRSEVYDARDLGGVGTIEEDREGAERGKMQGSGMQVNVNMAARYNTDDIVVRFVLFRSFNGPSRLGSTVSILFSRLLMAQGDVVESISCTLWKVAHSDTGQKDEE
ncbi:hypothetical protein BT69DRAFT_1331971 [Atractiella rhizophila]|nr:hypothetical protein BT69DRAFT_1331971 [Atractiella rhizophila]